jgi:hypothetical protein
MYALFAETHDTQERKFMGGLWFGLTEVENCVHQLMDFGTWPNKTIPVAVNLTDDMATYAYFFELDPDDGMRTDSEWQHVGRMVHETN